jgi:predicted Zn-dependent protease
MEPGDGAQATVTSERSLLLRFARSRPTQATSLSDITLELTAVRDGHVGSATTNRTDADALRECARAADAAARAAAAAAGAVGSYPGLPAPARAHTHDGHDPETARLDPAAGGAALTTAFEVAASHRVEAHGAWTAAEVETAVASSAGVAATDRVTDSLYKVTCIAPGGRSGYATQAAPSSTVLDLRSVADRAAGKSAGSEAPAKLEPGEYPVVLEPQAVGDLLNWLGMLAFNGLAYADECSALCGRLGTRVVTPSINLSDSPRYPGTLPRAFDAEGVPKAPLPLIQDGVAARVVHDTRSAALVGARSTGHALAPAGTGDGPSPTNLVMVGGGAADEAELCRPIERGVYVTRLWYTNAVRPKETLLTGLTRDGTFLIEDGQVTRPLHDLRFTDRVLDILSRVQDLGARTVLASEGEFYGRRFATGVVCPPLRAESMRFTA